MQHILKTRKLTTPKGFSLVEIALSIALLSIILLGIIAMFTQGMRSLSQSKQVTFATEDAQECLETIRALGASSIVVGTYDSRLSDPPSGGFPPAPYDPNPSEYPMVVEATTVGAPPNCISVNIDVYYDTDRKITLQTYFSL